jgi:predicted nuclease with TOPRIM domain
MTDLVQELRHHYNLTAMDAFERAADRIAQLERENAELRHATPRSRLRLEEKKFFNDRIEALERENADLKAEINRLLGIHKTLETAWSEFSKFESEKNPGRVIKFDNRLKK